MSRYSIRLLPSITLAGSALLAVGWAIRSGLDGQLDRSVLVVVSTFGLALVLDDRAASLTAATPIPLHRRRRWPVALGLVACGAGWAVAWVVVWVAPSRWDLFEWAVVAAGQLAVASAVTRRRPASVPIGPALTAAATWMLVTNLRDVAPRLYPMADHRATWLAIVAAFVSVGVGLSADPAAGRRRRGIVPFVALAALG